MSKEQTNYNASIGGLNKDRIVGGKVFNEPKGESKIMKARRLGLIGVRHPTKAIAHKRDTRQKNKAARKAKARNRG